MEQHGKHKLKIVNKLGRGAFGLVYKGIYDGQTVAVKTTDGEDVEEVAYKMIAREAQVLQQLNHGRIIGYKALCRLNTDHKHVPGGKWALVLEFAKGGTLQEKVSACMISGGKVYTNAQALSWALDVASALEYLHAQRPTIYHRDIKLSNIVLAAEDGQMVAKVNDFGLHVVADDTRDRLLRVSFSCGPQTVRSHFLASAATNSSAPATPRGSGGKADSSSTANVFSNNVKPMSDGSGSNLTPQCIQALQQQLTQATDAADAADVGAAGTAVPESVRPCFDKDSARQQQGKMLRPQRITATDDVSYGEMHDSSGSVPFSGLPLRSRSSPEGVLRNAFNQAQADKEPHQSSTAAAALAARAERGIRQAGPQQLQGPNGTRYSFTVPVAGGAGAAAGTGGDSTNYAAWVAHSSAYQSGLYRDDSICSSMATDCTWVTDGTGTADGSDDASSRTDVETVFNMTGQTGSCMYMSPEVFLRQPYNEKADVFSFGVVLYELLARVLLIFTELPTNTSDPAVTEWYARKVAGGYRPVKPKRMPDGVWRIIEACWQQEPCCRPSMSQVVADLQQLLQEEQQAAGSSRKSFSLANRTSTAAAAAAAAAAATSTTALPGQGTTATKAGSGQGGSQVVAAAVAGGAGLEGISEETSATVEAPSCGCVIC